ncbi:MAG: hypothetical protein ACK5AB_08565 [Bacteroidota bacterium]|jgi:hypothetical protein
MIPQPLRPVIWLFLLVNIFTAVFYSTFISIETDPDVLLIGNAYICILTLVSYWFMSTGAKSKSTVQFTSSVYGSFLIKMVLSVLIVVLYSKLAGKKMNSNGIIGCLFIYLIYMFLEVRGLMTLFRKD